MVMTLRVIGDLSTLACLVLPLFCVHYPESWTYGAVRQILGHDDI